MERPLIRMLRRWRQVATALARPRALKVIAALVACAALAGLLILRVGAANRAVSSAPTGSQVGHVAPDFTLAVWNGAPGQSVRLSALRGQPVVINFWATWCEPCQQEALLLTTAWQRQHARIAFLGVALDTQQSDGMAFLRRFGIAYPCGADPNGAIATAYALPGLPVTVFIDRRGVVAQRVAGQLTAATLDQGLQALLR
jgi:cytochrome c biogenesis protein CcmG/thiol:disulfide interchange protein DsbE